MQYRAYVLHFISPCVQVILILSALFLCQPFIPLSLICKKSAKFSFSYFKTICEYCVCKVETTIQKMISDVPYKIFCCILHITEDEVCTVELVGPIQVTGNSAAFDFRGVGSNILSYVCKLDGVQVDNCMLFIMCVYETPFFYVIV